MSGALARPELAVEDLTRRYGRVLAVDRLSFAAQAGEITGLLGPNGAGKTTTLLCLAGLLRPDAGRIAWAGRPLGPERGRVVALIQETPDVYDMLTVWEHLEFVARSCRLPPGWQAQAAALLERLRLAPRRDALGGELSKGMRQKTLIAAAVLARSPVLLLDEPMIGLDPAGQRELRSVLGELRDRGTAVLLSTHLLESAEALCDRLVIMKAGRGVAAGTLEELRRGAPGTLEDVFLGITG